MAAIPAFDPEDAFDAAAEAYRKALCDLVLAKRRCAEVAALPPMRQFEAMVCGIATGLISCAFAHVRPDGRDDVMRMLAEYLPHARLNAESTMREGLH